MNIYFKKHRAFAIHGIHTFNFSSYPPLQHNDYNIYSLFDLQHVAHPISTPFPYL